MRKNDIPDSEIPTADPEQVIRQYEPLIRKIARGYEASVSFSGVMDLDDMMQTGRIAILNAVPDYDPEKGKFITFCFHRIRREIWREICRITGIDSNYKEIPCLDTPINHEGENISFAEMIPAPGTNTLRRIIEEETREEIKQEVRAAVDRIKSEKQRTAIRRIYLENADREEVAKEIGVPVDSIRSYLHNGKYNLRHDNRLKLFAKPSFHVSVSQFRNTWTSAVEKEILWREQQYNRIHGSETYLENPEPDP